MKLQNKILSRLMVLAVVSLTLTQCVTQQVTQELDQNVEKQGESYARELAAQSPFKKVEMSWMEASELMKDRNPSYRKAITDKEESQIKRGLVNNLTFEVRKSLSNSVQTTLNPSELASAMKDPVASLPKQLESITDLKNITHSLTQSEWERVSQSMKADTAQRKEMVNLHALFCQSENLSQAEDNIRRIKQELALKGGVITKESKAMTVELTKAQGVLTKERQQWLDQVRNFFNAEYFDVEFNHYTKRLNFYRTVHNPEFSDWRRWRVLENSARLATEMQKQHVKEKPVLPGMNRIKQNFGVDELRSSLAEQSTLNESMAHEVRQMLKNWRNLKSVQSKIAQTEVSFAQSPSITDPLPSVADLKRVTVMYHLKKKEIEHLKSFWMIDEKCWKSEKKG